MAFGLMRVGAPGARWLACFPLVVVVGLSLAAFACRGPSQSETFDKKKVLTPVEASDAASPDAFPAKAPAPGIKAEAIAGAPRQVPASDLAEERDVTDVVDGNSAAPPEDPQVTLFRQLRDSAEAHVFWTRGLLGRETAIRIETDKLLAEEARLGVLRAIPTAFDAAQIEAEWQGLSLLLGFQIESWMISKSESDNRALPEQVPADKEFLFTTTDVRNVYQIVVRVPLLSEGDLKRVVEGVAGFQRLTLIRRIRQGSDKTHVINAEVYQFNPTDKPQFVVPERTVEAAMAQLGINLTLRDAVRKDPIGYVQTASLAYAEYSASRRKAEEVAVLEGRLLWLRARRAYFDQKASEVKSITLVKVLQPSTVGAK